MTSLDPLGLGVRLMEHLDLQPSAKHGGPGLQGPKLERCPTGSMKPYGACNKQRIIKYTYVRVCIYVYLHIYVFTPMHICI